ncbi:MAG TPA: YgjP-like metallopeptidase domain-containing protein [Candidatus Limnocylindrales bacterium]|nr:YgjP-like metallopeptidase domain-containing protein [Candidatus Limnocylindrales bacterium]
MKQFDIAGIGPVKIFKRKGSRSLRLSIGRMGDVRLTIPYLTPYAAGLQFLDQRKTWIRTNTPAPLPLLRPGDRIGKAHRLYVEPADQDRVTSRIGGSEIRIKIPHGTQASDHDIQLVIQRTCLRALRREASKLLPPRLRLLAEKHGFQYTDVSIKQLKGRWGSCDNHQRIVLNLYLMQLPWHLIDYVLLHELVHTKHMNHGTEFWTCFTQVEPRAKRLRLQIKTYQPVLQAVDSDAAMA